MVPSPFSLCYNTPVAKLPKYKTTLWKPSNSTKTFSNAPRTSASLTYSTPRFAKRGSCPASATVWSTIDKFPECGDQDEFLHYKLNRVLNCVPREEKMELFRQCHQMIAERKQYVQQKYQQEAAA